MRHYYLLLLALLLTACGKPQAVSLLAVTSKSSSAISESIPSVIQFVYRFTSTTGFHIYSLNESQSTLHYEAVAFPAYTDDSTGRVALYRCTDGVHEILTRDEACEGLAEVIRMGYIYEAPTSGHTAVYRLYNATSGDHLITTSSTEARDQGYQQEAILGYAPTYIQ